MQEVICDSQAGGVGIDSVSWLAAYTRPRFEDKFKTYCDERGIEVFLPKYQSCRHWSDRKKLLSLPLFPSYVFVRPTAAQRQRTVQGPGFLWFVHSRRELIRVDAEELMMIRRLLGSGLAFDRISGLQIGDAVEVASGVLAGCKGRLVRNDASAVVLQISAIPGSIRVNLPHASLLRPLRAEVARKVPVSFAVPHAVVSY